MPRLNWAWTCTSSQTWGFQKPKIKIKNKTRFGEGLNWTPTSLYPDIGIKPHKPMRSPPLCQNVLRNSSFWWCWWWHNSRCCLILRCTCQHKEKKKQEIEKKGAFVTMVGCSSFFLCYFFFFFLNTLKSRPF